MAHVELSEGFDMGQFQEGELNASSVLHQDSSLIIFHWAADRYFMSIAGQGLTYGGPFGTLMTGGVVQSLSMATVDGRLSVTNAQADGALLGNAYTQNDTRVAEAALLAGDDDIHVVDATATTSTPNRDHAYLAYGYAGNDLMEGGGQLSTFFGGSGNDTLQAASAAASDLSGDQGDDVLAGGAGADTLAGGVGLDVLSGGAGNDIFVFTASGAAASQMDTITDWQVGDRLIFGRAPGLAGNYIEATTASSADALAVANSLIAGGATDYVAVSVGSDVFVFADSRGDNGGADDAVKLSGRSLADISQSNIVAGPPLTTIAEPSAPVSPPTPITPSARITLSGSLDQAHLGDLSTAEVTLATGTEIRLAGGSISVTITGPGFVYDGDGDLIGGTITGLHFVQTLGGATVLDFNATFAGQPVSFLDQLESATDPNAAFQLLFGTTPQISGSSGDEVIHSGAGADLVFGAGGHDSIFGGAGVDVIFTTAPWGTTGTAAPSSGYLRGEDGDDYLVGGASFDDLQGNMGNDTEFGGLGDDWVVGGKDDDLLFGDRGGDIVYGNLGNDSCEGGAGDDLVRGGQGNDMVFGDAGADWLSGDRGDDTVVGGAGADIFHSFAEAGIDRVLDFTAVEGDRVQLDPATSYSVSQVGADTVVDMGGGNQMILVGVQLSTLPSGWIFGA